MEQEIKTGEVQIMSAGSGIHHSEYNYSKEKDVNFLQIWIMPKERNIAPRYDQKDFAEELKNNQLVPVVSPVDEGALWINQDAVLSLGHLEQGTRLSYEPKFSGNLVYAFLIEGEVEVNDCKLTKRDAAGFLDGDEVSINTLRDANLLLIEVPQIY